MDEPSKELIARAERNANGVSVSVTLAGQVYPVRFAASEDLGSEADLLLPLALFPAMVTGSRLKLLGEVSPRLLSAVPKIQDIFRVWGKEHWVRNFQNLQRVAVDAEVRSEPVDRASGVACFFSGGVDSFHTLLKHREEITHIIFVHGFDIALEDQVLRAQASQMAHEVAKELGKTLIEVETNLRSFSDEFVGWDKYHGAAMAIAALLFQHRFRKVLIASSHSYAALRPWGSHPMLDPLWGTESTTIEHDGCEATRVEKMAYISEYELPMQWLRICYTYHNPIGVYNCGRCGKCWAARVTLRTVGALERCKTLPIDLDLEGVASMDLKTDESRRGILQENLRALERLGTEPELAQTLTEAIDKSRPGYAEIERTRAQLERVSTRLANQTARYSSRRYKLADAIVDSALRIPGMRKLVRQKGAPTR